MEGSVLSTIQWDKLLPGEWPWWQSEVTPKPVTLWVASSQTSSPHASGVVSGPCGLSPQPPGAHSLIALTCHVLCRLPAGPLITTRPHLWSGCSHWWSWVLGLGQGPAPRLYDPPLCLLWRGSVGVWGESPTCSVRPLSHPTGGDTGQLCIFPAL